MARRCSFEVTGIKLCYNIAQIYICSCVVRGLWPFFSSSEFNYGLGFAADPTVEWWTFVFYCDKVLDLCDTAFPVLEKRELQAPSLHIWHSASIIVCFAYILRSGMGGRSSAVVPLCYSFVNMLVFSQCFVVMLVPSSSGWWQFVVGIAQVAQHFLVVLYWVLNRNFGDLQEITDRFSLVFVLWGISHLALFCKLSTDAATHDSVLAIRKAKGARNAKKKTCARTRAPRPDAAPEDFGSQESDRRGTGGGAHLQGSR